MEAWRKLATTPLIERLNQQAATDRAGWGVTDETPHVCDEAIVEIQRLRFLLSNIQTAVNEALS